MMYICVIILLHLLTSIEASPNGFDTSDNKYSKDVIRDANLDVVPLIQKYGYPAEVHTVTTKDGYILELHHIPRGHYQKSQRFLHKPPVLLIHGIASSSADWVMMGPANGLGYILADEGYDVWMGNTRGNYYSRKHTTRNPNGFINNKYWNFSWHEIGIYDLPAMIDYILYKTNKKALHFIGHCQGSTAFFVMTSLLPVYNDKILSMQALSPLAYMRNIKSLLIRILAPFSTPLKFATSLLGINEFLPNSQMKKWAGKALCLKESIIKDLCNNVVFLLTGSNDSNLNSSLIPILMGHTPAGASIKQLAHYGQLVTSGEFQQWDYGVIQNLLVYKQFVPPKYNLENIRVPISLYYSNKDGLTNEEDISRLDLELGNSQGLNLINFPGFSHLDFVWSMQARFEVYDLVIGTMISYE